EASVTCSKDGKDRFIALKQSRYLPLGSKGDANHAWQIPVCARYGVGKDVRESCTLLTEAEGKLELEGGSCPSWVMPNADGAGYYRFSLAAPDFAKLRSDGWPKLTTKERMSVANSVLAAFARASLPAGAILGELAPLAKEPEPSIAAVPMDLVRT